MTMARKPLGRSPMCRPGCTCILRLATLGPRPVRAVSRRAPPGPGRVAGVPCLRSLGWLRSSRAAPCHARAAPRGAAATRPREVCTGGPLTGTRPATRMMFFTCVYTIFRVSRPCGQASRTPRCACSNARARKKSPIIMLASTAAASACRWHTINCDSCSALGGARVTTRLPVALCKRTRVQYGDTSPVEGKGDRTHDEWCDENHKACTSTSKDTRHPVGELWTVLF